MYKLNNLGTIFAEYRCIIDKKHLKFFESSKLLMKIFTTFIKYICIFKDGLFKFKMIKNFQK